MIFKNLILLFYSNDAKIQFRFDKFDILFGSED